MPYPFRFATLLLCLCYLTACDDDFSLEGAYVGVPIAYAYLNADDDRHFVRVQKAFLEGGGNALNIAGIADSFYYAPDAATVTLTNLATNNRVVLERVDGANYGFEREEGTFATSPNILYTVSDDDLNLRPGQVARLEIERPGEETASAEADMLGQLVPISPRGLVRFNEYRRETTITFARPEGAEVFEVNLLMHIQARNINDPSLNEHLDVVWQVATDFVPSGADANNDNVRFFLDNEEFYRFIGRTLEPRDGYVYHFQDFDVQVIGAGEAVLARRALANANNGITSSQVTPRYSNIDGGIGLFTSITVGQLEGITLDNNSQDSLAHGIYTNQLRFRN